MRTRAAVVKLANTLASEASSCKGLGVEVPTEWYIKEGLANGRSTFELARAKGISESKIEQLRKYRNEQVGEIFRESIEPIDGVLETLENLYGRFLLAVVTGSRREHVD